MRPRCRLRIFPVGGGDEVHAYAGAKAGDGLTWAGGILVSPKPAFAALLDFAAPFG